MSIKLNLTLKYALLIEIFFIVICSFLVAIEYFIGSGTFTIRGTMYCLIIFQIPVIYLVIKHWMLLGKDTFIN